MSWNLHKMALLLEIQIEMWCIKLLLRELFDVAKLTVVVLVSLKFLVYPSIVKALSKMDRLTGMGSKILNAVSRSWKKEEVIDDDNGNLMSPSEILRFEKQTKLLNLENDLILKIFNYVNHGDLVRCRLINRRLNEVVSSSQLFLEDTVMVIAVSPTLEPQKFFPNTSFQFYNMRVQSLDYEVHVKTRTYNCLTSQNLLFSPPVRIMKPLKHLEFSSCFITWDTIKRVIIDAVDLHHISIIRCSFCDPHRVQSSAVLGEYNEYRVGETISKLKSIRISEAEDLHTISTILGKLIGFSAKRLEKVWISFDPTNPSVVYSDADLNTFCDLLRVILENNCRTLQSIHLDLKIQPLLNIIIQNVFGKMDIGWTEFNLREFVLSPPGCTPTPTTVDITVNGNVAAEILCGFFQTQHQLKKIAIPHIRRCGKYVGKEYRSKVLSNMNPNVEFLCVPNQEYLGPDFLMRLPKLKKIFIGGSVADNGLPISLDSKVFDIPIIEEPMAVGALCPAFSPEDESHNFTRCPVLDKIKELGLGSSIVNGFELTEIIKKLHYISKLEVTSQLPVMQDEDLQCCIENMPWLRKITISACDFLTDFGVTGILRNTCEMMVRLNNYHEISDSILNATGNSGKALSNLAGLKSLVLMGKSNITDIGISFGLRFSELSTVCLPYNENITDWGIEQFGQNNPSLEIFIAWALNKRSRGGYEKLLETHPRIRKAKCAFLECSEDPGVPNDFSASIIRFEVLRNSVTSALNGMCSSFNCSWLFGVNGVTSNPSSTLNLANSDSPLIPKSS